MKKKIVILSAFLTPFRSGAEACAEEVPLLLSGRYDFTIITCRMRRSLPKRDMLGGKIPVIRVGVGIARIDKWIYPFLASWEAKKHKPEIIHAILETFAGMALYLCKFTVPGAKNILTCQTTNRSFLKGPIVCSADSVTVISNYLADIVRSLGCDEVTVIPNGIHVKAFEDATKKYPKISGRILYVGRLEKMKGVDLLLQAFAYLGGDVHLRIVGNGSQRAALTQLANNLGIANRVTFAGHVPTADLYKEYAEADVFCGLSRSEALGNVFLEAMAGGCVVLASDIGGIKDIVQNRVDPNSSVGDLAKALDVCLNNSAVRESALIHGKRNTPTFNWPLIADRYAALYEKTLQS